MYVEFEGERELMFAAFPIRASNSDGKTDVKTILSWVARVPSWANRLGEGLMLK
jgi:hypothetical protein